MRFIVFFLTEPGESEGDGQDHAAVAHRDVSSGIVPGNGEMRWYICSLNKYPLTGAVP